MISILRILIVLAVALPVIALSGAPALSPGSLEREIAGVPTVVWLCASWFFALILAAWLPQRGATRR